MVELLQFIFSRPLYFLGTIILILAIGLAGNMILEPFGRPRTLYFEGDDGADDEEN